MPPLRSATSPPLKKLPLARTAKRGRSGISGRIAGPDFIHYAIFTVSLFFTSSPGIHTPPLAQQTGAVTGFSRRNCPARKAAALAKASVNKVVFSFNQRHSVSSAAPKQAGIRIISQVLATGISASSNSGQFSFLHYQGNWRYSPREIRWRYCAGHPVPAALISAVSTERSSSAQRSRRKMRLEIHQPAYPHYTVFFSRVAQTGTSGELNQSCTQSAERVTR